MAFSLQALLNPGALRGTLIGDKRIGTNWMRRCRFQRRFSSAGHRAYSIFRSNTTSMKQNELQSTRQTSPRAVSTTKVASAGAATPYAWKLVALPPSVDALEGSGLIRIRRRGMGNATRFW